MSRVSRVTQVPDSALDGREVRLRQQSDRTQEHLSIPTPT